MKCVENKQEFREYVRDELHKLYADKETVFDVMSVDETLTAIKFAVENPERTGINEEEAATLLRLAQEIRDAEGDAEKIAGLTEEVVTVMATRFGGTLDETMTIRGNLLRAATKDTVVDDQKEFPGDTLSQKIIRAIQHVYYYHETRSDYFERLLDEDTIASINNRMTSYARSSMDALPHFDSVFLVLQQEGAVDALRTIMTGVYMEALMAGYYAGARGGDCMMWHTHELGPVGRDDNRNSDTKVAEVNAAFDRHLKEE